MDSRIHVRPITMVHIIITEVSIIIAAEPTMADSETKTAVIRTTREIRITKTTDSETRTVVDLEIKAAVFRILREAKITVDSEILKAAPDQNLPVADSETAQAAKAVAAVVQPDNRAAEAALDKTIINKETNS
jgi:hypothetical protein